MGNTHSASLIEHLSVLEDPRIDRAKRHSLTDALTIAICAIVGGADSWTDVEMFGDSKRQWFDSFLELPNGIPSHDTFGRVFSMLDAEQFQSRFIEWVKAVSEVCNGQTVAIDGKSVIRSHDRFIGKDAIHMVGAWSAANRLVLGQVKVDDKSNEIMAIPELLRALDVCGRTVAIDAMGCQKEVAKTIIERGADYALALKSNQRQLYEDVTEMFDISSLPGDASRLLEAVRGHRGIENSVHWVLDVSFREDESRVRRGNSAEIFAAKRRMALNMLKQEKSLKVGIAAKRKRAGWDSEYLLKVLNQ